MSGHLQAPVTGEAATQVLRERMESPRHLSVYFLRRQGREFAEEHIAGLPLHEGRDGGEAPASDDQIPLPVPNHLPPLDLLRAVVNTHKIGNPLMFSAQQDPPPPPAGVVVTTQAAEQLLAKSSPWEHIEGGVDRLVTDVHRRISVRPPQP